MRHLPAPQFLFLGGHQDIARHCQPRMSKSMSVNFLLRAYTVRLKRPGEIKFQGGIRRAHQREPPPPGRASWSSLDCSRANSSSNGLRNPPGRDRRGTGAGEAGTSRCESAPERYRRAFPPPPPPARLAPPGGSRHTSGNDRERAPLLDVPISQTVTCPVPPDGTLRDTELRKPPPPPPPLYPRVGVGVSGEGWGYIDNPTIIPITVGVDFSSAETSAPCASYDFSWSRGAARNMYWVSDDKWDNDGVNVRGKGFPWIWYCCVFDFCIGMIL